MSKTRRQLAVELDFQQTTCKCGVARVKAQQCPDCGRPPRRHEVEFRSLERRAILADLQVQHEGGEFAGECPTEISDAISDLLAGLAARIAPAFKLAVMDNRPLELRALLNDLAATESRIKQWPNVRPYARKRQLAIQTVEHIRSAVSLYFEACTATNLADAQRYGALMQQSLDRGAAARASLVEVEEATDNLDYTTMESCISSLLESELRRVGLTLRQVIEGSPVLEGLLGVEPAEQLRLSFVLAAGAAEGLDRAEFVATFQQSLGFFRSHAASLDLLTKDTEFGEALCESDIVIANAVWQAHAALDRAQSDLQMLNAAATLNSDLVEGPGAVIARTALLLAGVKTQPYAKLANDNATTQIDRVAGLPDLSFLVAGIDTDLRVARSHNQLKIRHGAVTAVRQGRLRKYSTIEFVDTILHSLETVTAVTLAMKQVLAESGVDVVGTDLESIGLDEYALARIAIRELYEGDITLTLEDQTLRVKVADSPELNALALVSATGPFLHKADRFEVVQETRVGPKVLTGPTDVIRGSWPNDEVDRHLHMLHLMSLCKVNGEPAAGEIETRQALLSVAIPILAKEPLSLDDGRKLRKLIEYAEAVADTQLEAALRKCMRRMTGQPVPKDVIDQLMTWGRSTTDWKL